MLIYIKIKCKFDGVEFDMGQRVDQRSAALDAAHRATAHGERVDQFGQIGAAWDAGKLADRCLGIEPDIACVPALRQRLCGLGFD